MQDRYVGDVGDYGKYGLLRYLLNRTNLRLLVAWYRVINEFGNKDGKHTSYLQQRGKYRECDAELFDSLSLIISTGSRTLEQVDISGLFPEDSVFASEPLSYKGTTALSPLGRSKRQQIRDAWLSSWVNRCSRDSLVYLDPDNGIATDKTPATSLKHCFPDDIRAVWNKGSSMVIYHHLNRHRDHGTHVEQIQTMVRNLNEVIPKASLTCVHFRRGTSRAFFVAVQPTHADSLLPNLRAYQESSWKQHADIHFFP